MKKKVIYVLFTISLSVMLTACGHEHTWVDATCEAPKTCSECGETEGDVLEHTWIDVTCAEPKHCSQCGTTEGEALPHTFTEANYQQPATCEVCGETEGKPLQAYFEEYGLECNAELDTEYAYKTICSSRPELTTIGKLVFSNYEVFASDETHEALDGYEWRKVTATVTFDDENARKYGFSTKFYFQDYYVCSGPVNYNGIDYLDVAVDVVKEYSDWQNGSCAYTYDVFYRVPIGFDGAVLVFTSEANANKGSYIHEKADEDTIFFRLK